MYVESNEGVNERKGEGRKREEKQFLQMVHEYYLEFSLQAEKRDQKTDPSVFKTRKHQKKGETNRILKDRPPFLLNFIEVTMLHNGLSAGT